MFDGFLLKILQILHHGRINFAEVWFYFLKSVGGETRAFALASLYSPADEYLVGYSSGTLIVCRYEGKEKLIVIDVKAILSVVAMVPFRYAINTLDNHYFMIEKIGLDVVDTDAQEEEEAYQG